MKNTCIAFFAIALTMIYTNVQCQQTSAGLKKLILIRHGEKPEAGNNLSCAGLNRSLQLADVLSKKFGKVNSILIPAVNNGRTTNQARMFQTISPYAIRENMDINTKNNVSDIPAVVNAIRSMEGTVLLVWEHNGMEKIVKALGISEKQKWATDDYDSIWIITWVNGKAVLSKDSENIQPSATCN